MFVNKIGSILLVSILVLSFSSNSVLQKSDKESTIKLVDHRNIAFIGMAFAESSDESTNSTDQQNRDSTSFGESHNKTNSEQQSEYNKQDQNNTEGENHSEKNQQSLDDNNKNKTKEENQSESNQEGIDEINNQNNNEKATHQENQQNTNDIQDAIENKTVAAEVNIGGGNEEIKPIDDNIDVHTSNSTNDAVSVTVDSKSESGPKVIILNLNSTAIDVANVKYLHVMYDGHSIAPATDLNAVLHPKSTDEPSYVIIVTQNGAKILVSIPHFSTHTITLSNISKTAPVPEFPISIIVLVISVVSVVMFTRYSGFRLNNK